jgi:hypothetical protein
MNRNRRRRRTLELAALAVLAVGCAGANVEVVADHARYPISLSGSVRDAQGTLLDGRAFRVVGRLELATSRIGILYSTVTPDSKLDISDDVNAQVAAAGGEAVLRLSVTVADDCNVLNGFPLLNALPFWPGCVPVSVRGVIVRRTSPPVPDWVGQPDERPPTIRDPRCWTHRPDATISLLCFCLRSQCALSPSWIMNRRSKR